MIKRSLSYRSTELNSISKDSTELNISIYSPVEGKIEAGNILTKMSLYMDDLTLENKKSDLDGGAFYFYNPGWREPVVYFRRSTIENCKSLKNGGGGWVGNYANLVVKESTFVNNSADKGGSLFIGSNSNANISQTAFYDGNGTYGGSIYAEIGGNTTINDCTFENCKSSMQGGAIYIYRTSINSLLMDSCLFIKCSSMTGGALYISQSNTGSCVLSKICGYNCSVDQVSGGGTFLYSVGTSSTKTTMELLTISKCSERLNGQGTLYSYQNYCETSQVNFSKNFNYRSSCIYSYYVYGQFSSYTSFVKNNSTSDYMLCFYLTISNTNQYIYANIIENYSPNYLICKQDQYKQLSFSYTVFLNNLGRLFYVSSSDYLYLKSCYIKHDNSFYTGSIPTTELCIITASLTNTLAITHLSTIYCEAQIPHQLEDHPCQTLPPIPSTVGILNYNSSYPGFSCLVASHSIYVPIIMSLIIIQ